MNELKKDKPTELDALDYATLRAANAEVDACSVKIELLQKTLKELDSERGKLMNELCQKYDIAEGDQITADRKIVRKGDK